jgi:hypothetical protein
MKRTASFVLVLGGLLVLGRGTPALGQGGGVEEADKLVKQAQDLVEARKFDEAVEAVKKACKLVPDNALCWGIASDIHRKAGRFAEGIEYGLQAVKLDPKDPTYCFLVAANAAANQDLKLAREYNKKVLDKGEGAVKASIYHDARQLDDAISVKTYAIHWDLNPRNGIVQGGVARIALPRGDLPGQSVKYEVKGARSSKLLKTEANHLLDVVPLGLKPFEVTTTITLTPYSYKKELDKATKGPIPTAVSTGYLGPCESVNPKSPILQKIVKDLKADDRVQTVRNILGWLKKNVVYKNESAGIGKLDFKAVEEILDRGSAECRGYTMLFVGLCRAAGVPCRPVWGLKRISADARQPKGNFGSHNWAEVYFPGSGWIPVDPQSPETLGWLPATILRFYMDVRRNTQSLEHLPMRNLVHMNGETIRFEEVPASPGDASGN